MDRLTRRLAFIALTVALLLVIGTAGFVVLEGWSVGDAFYMTLITVTTVGYREIHDLHTAGRVFNSVLIVFGVGTIFFAIGLMTQSIIELELGEFFGKRRTKRMIDKMENHYIVCGYGRVGRAAAAEFQRDGVPLVVVDRNPDKIERASRAGIPTVQADSTRDEALVDAGVKRAKGLVAALATDSDNLFLILSAKTLNPELRVASRVGEEDAESKLRRAGADTVYPPYSAAGHQLALSLLRPHVVEFLDSATRSIGLSVDIQQMRISEGCEFVSKSLKQLQIRRDLGVIVLAIRKASGGMIFNPPAEEVLQGGDHIIVMGEHEALRKLESLLMGVHA